MRRLSVPLGFGLVLLLAACVDTTGLSGESSRPPKGNPDAVVLVQEYTDLQCPACRAAHSAVTTPLLEKYGTQIRFEFEHFPLRSIHRFAMEAAEAAECAADRGKFWEFVDIAFEKQPELKSEALRDWAKSLALDTKLFERCVTSKIKRDTILSDYEEGREKGVQGTPTYFVNGQKIETGLDTIGAAIESSLKGMQQRL